MKCLSLMAVAASALSLPLAAVAQTTVFSDTFGNGSTINGTSTPGGTAAASSTSYDFDSQKTGVESISAGHLSLALSGATTSGMIEAQAVFTSTPVTLSTVGDSINLTYTFTDTANLLAGGASSVLYTGLYSSGGSAPIAGTGVSGNAVSLSGAASPTGGSQNWQGYFGRIAASGGTSALFTRPAQTGGSASGTSSAQDLVGNNSFTGGFGKTAPSIAATQVGSGTASTVVLTAASQYTVSYTLTLASSTSLTLTETLNGPGATSSQTVTATGASFLAGVTSFDGFAIGDFNSGTSLNPQMDLNSVLITENIQATPEPTTLALLGSGAVLTFLLRRRQSGK